MKTICQLYSFSRFITPQEVPFYFRPGEMLGTKTGLGAKKKRNLKRLTGIELRIFSRLTLRLVLLPAEISLLM
jgi:hypothetical protein